jgi:hypothetical protein
MSRQKKDAAQLECRQELYTLKRQAKKGTKGPIINRRNTVR